MAYGHSPNRRSSSSSCTSSSSSAAIRFFNVSYICEGSTGCSAAFFFPFCVAGACVPFTPAPFVCRAGATTGDAAALVFVFVVVFAVPAAFGGTGGAAAGAGGVGPAGAGLPCLAGWAPFMAGDGEELVSSPGRAERGIFLGQQQAEKLRSTVLAARAGWGRGVKTRREEREGCEVTMQGQSRSGGRQLKPLDLPRRQPCPFVTSYPPCAPSVSASFVTLALAFPLPSPRRVRWRGQSRFATSFARGFSLKVERTNRDFPLTAQEPSVSDMRPVISPLFSALHLARESSSLATSIYLQSRPMYDYVQEARPAKVRMSPQYGEQSCAPLHTLLSTSRSAILSMRGLQSNK